MALARLGNMTSASVMHEKMLFLGCAPDVVTFTSRIDGYCRIGQNNRLNEACDLLRLLKLRNDIIPQPFMYNPVIDGLCKAGKVDEANQVVSEMEQRKCKHDKYTFTILIIGHCMKGRMSEAIKIFDKMLSVKCIPDDVTVKSFAVVFGEGWNAK
ncbi:hypothetical protein RDABS01_023049 [Bienertia sinuspersici]